MWQFSSSFMLPQSESMGVSEKGQFLKKITNEKEKIMGRHGENIRKRKDGRWEARYTVYDSQKEKRVGKSVYGHTYDEVKKKRADILYLLENPPEMPNSYEEKRKQGVPGNILFETAAEEWLDEVRANDSLKPSTLEKYSMVYYTHLKGILGKTSLDKLTDSNVKEKISDHLSSAMLACNTQKGIYCVLNQILRYASTRYSIMIPIIKRPAFSMYQKPVKIFTEAEQSKLLTILYHQTDIFKMAVLLCMFAGLRIGELCALKWSDIDLDNKTLTVKRTVQRLYAEGSKTKTILVETAPKSSHSMRDIPLPESVINLLLGFQNQKEYIFGGKKPLDPKTMRNHYKKILEEACIAHKTFHTLRHTYATNCVEGGVDTKSLCEMLGHSNVRITLNYYMHPSIDTKRKHVDRLYNFYEKIRGQIKGKAS